MKLFRFFTLVFCLAVTTTALSQEIEYGNNPAAGHYFDVGNCKLYYEIYGQGEPIILLHGGVYGYITEFTPFIEKFKQNYQVICIATRGHGKSEIGHVQYSYNQRADDAYKVIRSITKDSVIVLGFSDGGFAGLKLAAVHPELVKKLIVIGAGDMPKLRTGKTKEKNYTPDDLMKNNPDFFKSRLALMPEPSRWGEHLKMINQMYNTEFMSKETFEKIKCPTLLIEGDRDENRPPEDILKCKNEISNSQLAIIPGCGHTVFYCNFPAVWAGVEPFLEK